jgi:hypothetical protein
MKKDISLAVMATILILQLVSNVVGGVVGKVADELSKTLSARVQVEQLYYPGGFQGESDDYGK